jgi:MtN3 and saliva related transmembrane protein
MSGADWVGWGASAILIATLARQVIVQWRERSIEGVSSWLFVGQLAASIGFTVYSWLVGNAVFVFTNSVLLLTAVIGQLIYRRNRRLAEAEGVPTRRGSDGCA